MLVRRGVVPPFFRDALTSIREGDRSVHLTANILFKRSQKPKEANKPPRWRLPISISTHKLQACVFFSDS
ncbi:hypothetical protein ACOSQ4_009103 [Xanthoceras sorbifolium]